jgi:hypothetical protein
MIVRGGDAPLANRRINLIRMMTNQAVVLARQVLGEGAVVMIKATKIKRTISPVMQGRVALEGAAALVVAVPLRKVADADSPLLDAQVMKKKTIKKMREGRVVLVVIP